MTPPPRSRPTVADVAARAEVSVPTVSKVLNNRPDIAAATRRRVEEAIEATGYRRRPSVRRGGRSGLIDVVVHRVDSPWVLEVLAGAERAASASGVNLVLSALHGEDLGDRWVRAVERRRSDGVVVVVTDLPAEALERLIESHVPVVLLDRTGESDPRLGSVGATNWAGALSATQHLLDLGHRRIAVISGHPRLACSAERIDGYLAALRRADVPVEDQLIVHGDFYPEGGRLGAERLLSLPEPPTAIFAGSDLQAFGVYEVAKARGLRIPEDLSVVGFDDLPLASYVSPRLTTVRQPHADMAAEAVRMVLAMGATEGPVAPVRRELATSLVVRDSTRSYAPPL